MTEIVFVLNLAAVFANTYAALRVGHKARWNYMLIGINSTVCVFLLGDIVKGLL